MISANYTFFQNNQWQFSVASRFDLAGFSAFCTAIREDTKINADISIQGDNITITFNSTEVPKGIYKYDVEVNNGTENYTLQKGEIVVL